MSKTSTKTPPTIALRFQAMKQKAGETIAPKTTITKFGKGECAMVGATALALLKDYADELGLKVETAGGSFDELTFTARIKFSVNDAQAVGEKAQADFESWAGIFGVHASAYGQEFEANGETFRLTGIEPSRTKFPFSGERVRDGKRFKFPAENIARKFGVKPKGE